MCVCVGIPQLQKQHRDSLGFHILIHYIQKKPHLTEDQIKALCFLAGAEFRQQSKTAAGIRGEVN